MKPPAIIGAAHCQIMGIGKVIAPMLPATGRYMEPLYPFDGRLDAAGILHLMTPWRTVRHLGNRLMDEDRKEIAELLEC
jgi:hypothetical protein